MRNTNETDVMQMPPNGAGANSRRAMATSKRIRRWLLVTICILAFFAVLLMLSTRTPKAAGGYEFSLTTSENGARVNVEYLSFGRQHELLTCGPRQATTFDVRLNRFAKWIGIQRYFTPVAYLCADHNRDDQELVVYASFASSPDLQSVQDALAAYYVDEHHQHVPMQFAIGKSNPGHTRYLVAWKICLPTPPAESCSVEIVEPASGKQCVMITRLKAASPLPTESRKER